MSAGGLECYDENGKILFKAQSCTTRVLGRFFTGTKNGSHPITIPEGYRIWTAQGHAKLDNANLNNPKAGFVFPVVKYEDGKIVWTFNGLNGGNLITYMGVTRVNVNTEIIYGMF